MVIKGFTASVDDAFHRLLGDGKPAYVDKYRVECVEAIQTITGAGGIPVLAHPGLLGIENEDHLNQLIGNLKDIGIKGIEVYYTEHSPRQTKTYIDFARRFDLLMTGGTDFHGALMPEIKMGSGRGNLMVPYELFEKLGQ
jgi:predicted metal-dependent phosphoesterase TrpH